MTERQFTEDYLAALYDAFHPPTPREDLAFYLPLVMAAPSVLDVGCGTGALLRRSRESGHTGRLCGLDPAEGMLKVARQSTDIEWVLGDLSSVRWDRDFDLVIMTGHAFQELDTDEEIRTALATIRSALTDDGRFAFETRNPLIRPWERWPREYSGEVLDADGAVVRRETTVEMPVQGDVVHFTTRFSNSSWGRSEVSRGRLRFLSAEALWSFLSDAGFVIEEQFGDWHRQPLSDTGPEIITVARRGKSPSPHPHHSTVS